METIALRADELEALRLADFEGLYQKECARRMGISRTTLSRTLAEAHRKVVDALLNGKRLVVAEAREAVEAVVSDEPSLSSGPHQDDDPPPRIVEEGGWHGLEQDAAG